MGERSTQDTVPENLQGYRINAGGLGQAFSFPDFTLPPDATCRVYTSEDHAEHWLGEVMSFRSGWAIWNNRAVYGYLNDATGAEVTRRSY